VTKPSAPLDLSKVRHVHLIAICGTGMGGLAGILKALGYEVTGSDENVYPPMSIQLRKLGIEIQEGYSAKNLKPKPDLIVIGNAIRRENPEAQATLKSGIPYLSFPGALREFALKNRRTIALCGTHGKTTTTALLAHLFTAAGRDPSFLIGGVAANFDSGIRIGEGEDFIIEGDEYDTAFFDKVPKFLRYAPDWAVIGNVEFDHADIYDDLDQIKAAFSELIEGMPKDGVLFAGTDCPTTKELVEKAKCEVITFGLNEEADYRPELWQVTDAKTRVSVLEKGERCALFTSVMTGEHNLKNLLATVAVAKKAGFDKRQINESMESFRGIKRRQEVRGFIKGVTVIDDFAHHPTAVAGTLAAMKNAYPGRRIIAAFEPRTNTSRRNLFQDQYAEAFVDADLVLIAPVHAPEAIEEGERFSPEKLIEALMEKKIDAAAPAGMEELTDMILGTVMAGDIIVLMSNGAFGGVLETILERLRGSDETS
jgi:UDP-N-acetylmuramate: L-alanyl-gamma-D-glutamyl-meso-diaminopimelate ligase